MNGFALGVLVFLIAGDIALFVNAKHTSTKRLYLIRLFMLGGLVAYVLRQMAGG